MSGPGSGIKVVDEVETLFKQMQRKKDIRCVILKIADDDKEKGPEVVIEKVIDKKQSDEEDFKTVLCELKDTVPRYLVMDIKAPPAKEGAQENDKLLLITWNPDSATIKEKMWYSSTKGTVVKKLPGIAKEIQANDWEDLQYQGIRHHLKGL